uniref:peptidylprolyl isomerase n=1 Tax=Myotis myotis TaxID=51298 RepID=A0A7J7V309_MYOMY|nr:FKBP prolyl isomerase 9 [Myotis myotis]
MDMGLREMCVGEKRTVIIPPHLGYGEAGVDGEVPGSAVLVFDIELLELVAGLPEGYMFIWNDEVSSNLFEEIDKDGNGEVLLEEVTDLCRQVGPEELREPSWAREPSQRGEDTCVHLCAGETLHTQAPSALTRML